MTLLSSEKAIAAPQSAFAPRTKVMPSSDRTASRVEVYDDPQHVLEIWQDLIAVAPASVYQTPGFLIPWLATRGVETGITPKFVVQKDNDGTVLAMFCLGLKQFGLFHAAIFLGAKDSNFNFGLFRPGYAPDRAALTHLLRAAARKMGSHIPDLLLLYNQPRDWNGWVNPLSALPRQMSPSFAYKANLGDDAERYFAAKLSKDSRKKFRKKESRLAEIGTLQHLNTADSPLAREKIIAAFFEQKIARFEIQNIEAGFKSPVMRGFVEAALQPSQSYNAGALELHALFCGERIVAVYGGATHQGHFSAFFNSFNADPEIAKSSPGDLLLLKLIAEKCKAGIKTLDLGIGEARYKNMVCDETMPLFDSFVPVTLKGQALASAFSIGLTLKRWLKQNQRAFKIVKGIRTMLRHKP
jgi:CelD/BcsL family acetyltransferase involved in cellulose biosynthesis